MKLTTTLTTARALGLALALSAVGTAVAAGADPPPGSGGTSTTQVTSTTNQSNSTSSSTSTGTSSGGTSTCQTRVVVKVDGQIQERTERSSGPSCTTRVEVRDRKVTISGSASADGPLTPSRAGRFARSVLEKALGE